MKYIRKTTVNHLVTFKTIVAFLLGLGLATVFYAIYSYFRSINQPLLSPVDGLVQEVHASEPYKISCDNPKGYLECQVYKNMITWKDYDKLYQIINCESKWNSEAIHYNSNGTYDMGLFQLNTVHKYSKVDMFDFRKNIDLGIAMYKKQGVRPWTCSRILKIK